MSTIFQFTLLVAIIAATPNVIAESILRITKPSSGTVVNPGQTIAVSVSSSGEPFTWVSLIVPGQHAFDTPPLTSQPYEFSFTVPAQITPGMYTIAAWGKTATEPVFSEDISIDIERNESPQKISTNYSELELEIGDAVGIQVYGTYSDSSVEYLNKSTHTKFEPTSRQVVSVTKDGFVTALGVGTTTIVVRHQNRQAIVKVIVTVTQSESNK